MCCIVVALKPVYLNLTSIDAHLSNGRMHTFKLALVTGASSGIGKQLAWLLAQQGIALIIHGRAADVLAELAADLSSKVQVFTLVADLSLAEGQEAVVSCIRRHVPDLIINNAGFGLYGPALDYSVDEQLSILKVNAEAAIRLSLEAAQALKNSQRTGVIMNVSSASAFVIAPYLSIYAGSKALLNHFSESFDEELRPFGIRSLVACPGVVRTSFRQRAAGLAADVDLPTAPWFAMEAEFAAQRIWQQILSGQKVCLFHWPYRVLLWFVKYFLPKKVVAKIMASQIQRLQSKK